MANILVIDDDEQILSVVRDMLLIDGHTVELAADGNIAAELFKQKAFDLVITDLIMPEKEGMETIVEIRTLRHDIPIIAMSGGGRIGTVDYLNTAKYIGADATLAKPFSLTELSKLVSQLLDTGSGS
ncbi:MAG: response regulator [Pseudomonadales bacterium]|nr:response regulator [Pseudomonadales bacterium]